MGSGGAKIQTERSQGIVGRRSYGLRLKTAKDLSHALSKLSAPHLSDNNIRKTGKCNAHPAIGRALRPMSKTRSLWRYRR